MKRSEYYLPYLTEKQLENGNLEPSFQKITNRLIDFILSKDIAIETGGGEVSVKKHREEIKQEITQLVALKTAGLDPQSEQAHRVRILAKDLVEALLSGTMIKSLHKSDYLSAVALGLELAKEPTLVDRLAISTGFGGSDQKDINLRLPAYILPGINIIENIKTTFSRNNLSEANPTFRIFFAPHAAIRVNGAEMRSDLILKNLGLSYNYLKEYIHCFHPDLEQNVLFQVETPWEEHDELTTLTLNYFSSLLEASEDKSVSGARDVLKSRGHNHGGDSGSNLSLLYAAAHSLFFKDGLNHPGSVFADKSKPLFAISAGGRPERLFNTMRTYLRANSSVEGFLSQMGSSKVELNNWQESVYQARSEYNGTVASTAFHPSDLPLISIPGITTVGSHPVYYESPYDIGIHQTNEAPLVMLQYYREKIKKDESLSGQERSLELDRLKAIEHDIQQVVNDVGSEDQLLTFIETIK